MTDEIRLEIPEQHKPTSKDFNCRASNIRAWVQDLPMTDLGHASQAIFNALSDINHQSMPVKQRMNALETLTPSIEFVSESLKQHFISRTLPLTNKQLHIAMMNHRILRELATGYTVLVVETVASETLPQKDSLLHLSLFRAMQLLNNLLLQSFQTYTDFPHQIWKEVHTLYWQAESLRLNDKSVTLKALHEATPATISGLYKQILLLTLSCPYRLRRGVAEKIHMSLASWQEECELLPVDTAKEPLFITDLASNQPPHYFLLSDKESHEKNLRGIDTEKLSSTVRAALKSLRKTGHSEFMLNASTLRRLMLSWGVMPRRRYNRNKEHARIITTTSLGAIHYFISGEAAFSASPELALSITGLGSENKQSTFDNTASYDFSDRVDSAETPDMWEMNYTLAGDLEPSSTEDAVAHAALGMKINRAYSTHEWKMINVSAGGYCLIWDNKKTTRAQVGELIGIREESNPDTFQWRLGVIRWMKTTDANGLELGIQMLSPSAIAISAKPLRKRSGVYNHLRGLLLPEIASIHQGATLLLPSPPFRTGDVAHINCNGRDIEIKLTKLVENTGSFAQFQFAVVGQIKPNETIAEQATTQTR